MIGQNKLKIIIILLVMGLFITSGISLASITVEPSRFIFVLEEGERTTGTIKVTNNSKQEVELEAVLYDWTLNNEDRVVTYPAGSKEYSLDGLIKFNPRHFKLAPGETQLVRFTIEPQPEQNVERRGVVFFEQEFSAPQGKTGAKVVAQVGTTIYLIKRHAEIKFNLALVTVHFNEDGSPMGIVLTRNKGKTHIRYLTSYQVVNEQGEIVDEGDIPEVVLLPGCREGISFPLKELKPGKYNLNIFIRFFGAKEPLTHTEPFTVKE